MTFKCDSNVNSAVASLPHADRSQRSILKHVAKRTNIESRPVSKHLVGNSETRLRQLKMGAKAYC